MSDQGEKTCPLCAEEMDLTDQQLKPCKCGYQICVWCWHQIMNMAEKDETEGRCPACRTAYDKEKIVGMAANCERLVAEINMEKKKSQKSKIKSSSEGRKQLSSVRVIQRNLVYIVGLPLDLADEDLLQRKEYFGQYGKVLKASMSRTAAGVIQQFPNSTCSVYITYSKEEEAIRCIQSVHGFILEGKSLKACFGTTKYCHAWLRNAPCNNPDCLYLHEVGSQEDSFTKDEIISAYTRSRVQQITGGTSTSQWRSGNILPPPADDYCINSSASAGRAHTRNASNIPPGIFRGSPPSSSSGPSNKSTALPPGASWGMRGSNQTQPASSVCLNEHVKQKPDTVSGLLDFSSAVASTSQVSGLHGDVGKKQSPNDSFPVKLRPHMLKPVKHPSGMDDHITASEKHATEDGSPLILCPSSKDSVILMPSKRGNASGFAGESCFGVDKEVTVSGDTTIQRLCSDMSTVSIDKDLRSRHAGILTLDCAISDLPSTRLSGNESRQETYPQQFREHAALFRKAPIPFTNGACLSEKGDGRLDSHFVGQNSSSKVKESALFFQDQMVSGTEGTTLSDLGDAHHILNYASEESVHHSLSGSAAQIVNGDACEGFPTHATLVNGYRENVVRSSSSINGSMKNVHLFSNRARGEPIGRSLDDVVEGDSNAGVDTGENSIISNILSMGSDAWDDSLTSPQNLAKLLGGTDKHQGPLKLSSSWKLQNSNQSRFSFARQEESQNQAFDDDMPLCNSGQMPNNCYYENGDTYLGKVGMHNGLFSGNFEALGNFASSQHVPPLNKHSGSRAQVSAPPGFSAPSRAPPPGFASHDRSEPVSAISFAGTCLLDSSSLRNSYQSPFVPSTGSLSTNGDIEFMDPAILAVGKERLVGGPNTTPGLDTRLNFPSQLNAFEDEARLQLLMQRSLLSQQNLRFNNPGDGYDAFGTHSSLIDQSGTNHLSAFAPSSLQQSRSLPMSNGHWDGWSETQAVNSIEIAELLRKERLGLNKLYGGYEDKFRMPASGDLYNRTFGM